MACRSPEEYAETDWNGSGVLEYATDLSTEGKKDGLSGRARIARLPPVSPRRQPKDTRPQIARGEATTDTFTKYFWLRGPTPQTALATISSTV
jgi:hypothetical protein